MTSNNQLKLCCVAFLTTETLATVVAYALTKAMVEGYAGWVATILLVVDSAIAFLVLQIAARDALPLIGRGVFLIALGLGLGLGLVALGLRTVGVVILVLIALHMLVLTLALLIIPKLPSNTINLDSDLSFLDFSSILLEDFLESIAPKTWSKTRDSFLDTIETFPDEVDRWEQRNLKFVAYLITAVDLAGFCFYFTRTAIFTAISARIVSR